MQKQNLSTAKFKKHFQHSIYINGFQEPLFS